LIAIAEAISEMVLIKSLLSYISNHSLMKIISQEYSIEEHDSVIGQIIMVLILQILNVLTQEFKCENI